MQIPQFSLLGIPVTVHRSVGLLMLLLLAGGAGPARLSGADAALWTAALLAAALAHELGHALVARGLGLRGVEIELTGFGGLTRHPDPASPARRLAIALAGPAAGILAGGACLALHLASGWLAPAPLLRALWALALVSIALSLANLLPLGPLDGRRIVGELARLRRAGSGAYGRALGGVAATVGAGILSLAWCLWVA